MNKIFRYVVSEQKLQQTINHYVSKNVYPILDYAIEFNNDKQTIRNYVDKKLELFNTYPFHYHSLKPSSINFNLFYVAKLVREAKHNDVKLVLDAENYAVQDKIDDITNTLMYYNYDKDIFITYQMYRHGMYSKLLNDIELFKQNKLTHNIKLVRGAYINKDLKHIYPSKIQTDKVYNTAVKELLKLSKNNDQMNVIFATHNIKSFNLIRYCEPNSNVKHASLLGMDDVFEESTVDRMVHIPFGPWNKTYPYMIRRLYENNPINDKLISYRQKQLI